MPITEITWDPDEQGMLGVNNSDPVLIQQAPDGEGVTLSIVGTDQNFVVWDQGYNLYKLDNNGNVVSFFTVNPSLYPLGIGRACISRNRLFVFAVNSFTGGRDCLAYDTNFNFVGMINFPYNVSGIIITGWNAGFACINAQVATATAIYSDDLVLIGQVTAAIPPVGSPGAICTGNAVFTRNGATDFEGFALPGLTANAATIPAAELFSLTGSNTNYLAIVGTHMALLQSDGAAAATSPQNDSTVDASKVAAAGLETIVALEATGTYLPGIYDLATSTRLVEWNTVAVPLTSIILGTFEPSS